MKNNYFNRTDALVFTAFFMTHENTSEINLSAIIGAGDALSHAIFSPEEIISAFGKFQRKSIVLIEDTTVTISDTGKEIIENCQQTKGGLFSRVDITLKKLNSSRNRFIDNDIVTDLTGFVKNGFNEAYKRYHDSANRQSPRRKSDGKP